MAVTQFPHSERTSKSQAIHSTLDEAAAAINDFHARVLSSVIEAQAWKIHRDIDGYSGLRDWLCAKFDFHTRTAADLAAIARCARKFTVLGETATSGSARIDLIAAAVRRLEATKALRLYAKTAYREPVVSPFSAEVQCATPEHLISEWCKHSTVKEVHARLDEIEAALDSGEEILEGLGQDSLQRLELVELENGMWALDATLSADTGQLFAKYLTTAVPPPRQEETDADGVLPREGEPRCRGPPSAPRRVRLLLRSRQAPRPHRHPRPRGRHRDPPRQRDWPPAPPGRQADLSGSGPPAGLRGRDHPLGLRLRHR